MSSVAHLTYIGHATLFIEMDGVRLLTDPILLQHVRGFLLRHRIAPLVPVGPVDAVLISHLHLDHFDLPSLRQVGQETLLIAPRGSAPLLQRHGFHRVIELGAGEQSQVGPLTITATYADHGRRTPFRPALHCLGYLIKGSQCIYFAGDTDLFPGMAALRGGLDMALLPVWGWGPRLGAGHMNPERAAEALTLLQPTVAIPIHWGTLHPRGMGWWQPRFLSAPPHRFAHHARQVAPDVQVKIVKPGHAVTLKQQRP
ncbi:MAG: MBL fold metallo-hydrolase [Caldilineaceae bacterium]|nr:MBL fold metallo-hydrolase [Caldilineaceae bacterium]